MNDYIFDDSLILLGEDGENILSRNTRLAFRISGKSWVNNHAHVLRPNSDVNIGFLVDYLESLNYEQFNSGTAQPKLNKQTCFRILVALPPTLQEQEAIAAALNDADVLIESLEQLIEKKCLVKQGGMQELLSGRRRLPEFRGEWKSVRVDSVADADPENLSCASNPDYTFKYISLEDVKEGALLGCVEHSFRTAPSRARRIIAKNDILVGTVRPNLKSHLLFREVGSDWICSTGFCVLRPRACEVISDFLYALFFSEAVSRQINNLLAGSNYPAISNRDVRSLEIPLPPYDEQQAIGGILRDLDAEIEALEARLEKARQIKQGMMQQLLMGRTRLV